MATTVFDLQAILGLDTSKFESGLNKAKGLAGSVGSGLASAMKVGVAAVGAATTAVTAFGVASVKTGATFDKSMSQVAATMGLSMEEMENAVGTATLKVNGQVKEFSGTLRDFAQEMGRNTAFTASQAADALNYMALAGYDVQTSMNMLPNVLNLAAAGDMDLARASDMVTDAATAMGLTLEDGSVDIQRTTQMVDEMAKAASTGNTSVEQLGDAFLVVGGLAKELNGGMVTLKDGTTKSVDGLQEMEIALTAMANAGIKGSEAGTHMRNMIMKLSKPTSAGVKTMAKLGIEVFDTSGQMRSLADIMNDLSGALGNVTQEEKIQAISDLFNARDLASAEALLGAVNQDWNKIGESILNAEGAAQKMADTQLDNLAGDITLFKSALEGAQIAISDGLSPQLREFVQFGTEALSTLTEAFQSDKGVSGAVEAFGKILSDGLNMIIKKLPDFVDAGIQLLGAVGQGLLDNLPTITNAAGRIILQLVKGLISALPSLVEGAIEIVGQLVTFLGQQLPVLIPASVDMILSIVNALIDNIDLLIDGAIALMIGLAEGLIKALPKLLEKAPVIIEKLVEAIITNVPKLIVAAGEAIASLVKGIITNLPKMVEAGMKIVSELNAGIVRFIFKVYEAGRQMVQKIWDGLKTINPIKWGEDMIDSFIAGIRAKIASVKKAATDIAKTVKSILGFSEPEEGPLSNFHTFAPDMMKLFAKGIEDNMKLVTDAVNDTAFNVAGGFTSGVSSAPVASSSTSGIESILSQYLDEFRNMKLYLDTGALVGGTVNAYNDALGVISSRGGRR